MSRVKMRSPKNKSVSKCCEKGKKNKGKSASQSKIMSKTLKKEKISTERKNKQRLSPTIVKIESSYCFDES